MSAVRFQIPKTEEEWQTAIRDADARDRNGSSGIEPHVRISGQQSLVPTYTHYVQAVQAVQACGL